MGTRYIDFTRNNGNISGTWTNTGTSFAGSGGAALTELAVGDYIGKASGKKMWYQVTAIANDNSFTVNFDPGTAGLAESFSAESVQLWDASANNGQSTGAAYCSLHCALAKEVMGGGDIWYYRGGQEEYVPGSTMAMVETAGTSTTVRSSLIVDTDGSVFSDSSPGRTTIRYLRGRTTMFGLLNYVYIKGIKTAAYGTGDTRLTHMSLQGYGWKLENCYFSLDGFAAGDGFIVNIINSSNIWGKFIDCDFETSGNPIFGAGLNRNGAQSVIFQNCGFGSYDSTARGTALGFTAGKLALIDCKFGGISTDANRPLVNGINVAGGFIYGRRLSFNCTNEVNYSSAEYDGLALIEDYDLVAGDNRQFLPEGIISSETSVVRSGGGDKSIELAPTSLCVSGRPLEGQAYPFEIPVYIESGAARTVTVYVNTYGFSSLPTADELKLSVDYLNHATNASMATVTSTETVSANGSWTAFSVTFTPQRSGLAYCKIMLQKYEASSGVYVDPVPVVS